MKRRNFLQQQRSSRWRIKALVVVLLLTSCFLLILNHYHYSRIFTFGAPEAPPLVVVQKPKIAFLFIARNRLPLDFVWDAFFQVLVPDLSFRQPLMFVSVHTTTTTSVL